MPTKARHSGLTDKGNLRDAHIERIRNVTIYKRGLTYYLYYRENGKSVRSKVDGNIATARATASKSGCCFGRSPPVAFRLQARWRPGNWWINFSISRRRSNACPALPRPLPARHWGHFKHFAASEHIKTVDQVDLATVDAFVKWLRTQHRSRNGAQKGAKAGYRTGGIKFILSTCRTAFNWAAKRRLLPP